MKRIIVYTTDNCASCLSVKALLKARGLDFEEINLSRDPDGRAELESRTGLFTFPQVVVNGQTLGGFQDVLSADRSGRLGDLLAA